jgi:hypothetical protein
MECATKLNILAKEGPIAASMKMGMRIRSQCNGTVRFSKCVRALLIIGTSFWIVFGFEPVGVAAEPTAFELVKEGNRYVGEESKDKVVQIRSERSVGGTTPKVWHIVYYDPNASLKAVEVKFVAGKKEDVTRPLRLLEPISGSDQPLDRQKMKVDSDAAIKKALKEPILENIKVTSAELKLERVGEGVLERGGVGEPTWKIKLWASKIKDPTKDQDIGEIWLSSNDGKITKTDLHIDRLN